jgi:Na+-transporting NADH:ubiquinone oxidoreductase subunit NqrA
VMLLSYVCPSKTDYGLLLRNVLEQLREEAR